MSKPVLNPPQNPPAEPLKKKFTKRFLEGLKPRAKRYSAYDTQVDELRVRMEPSGSAVFEVNYRAPRAKNSTSKCIEKMVLPITPEKIEEIRDRARDMLQTIKDGQPIMPDKSKEPFMDVAKAYLGAQLALKRTNGYTQADLDTVLNQWPENERKKFHIYRQFDERHPGLKIGELTSNQIGSFFDYIAAPTPENSGPTKPKKTGKGKTKGPVGSLYAAHKAQSAFSTLVKWAVQENYLPADVYPREKGKYSPPETLPEALDEDEVEGLLSLLEADFDNNPSRSAALQIIFHSGARITETLLLRWRDVRPDGEKRINWIDTKKRQFTYEDHKNAHKTGAKKTAMGRKALAVIEQLRERNTVRGQLKSIWLFPSAKFKSKHVSRPHLNKYFLSFLPRLAEEFKWPESKLKSLTQYNLRHSFATVNLATGNLQPAQVQRQMGHGSPAMTARYQKLLDTQLEGYADKI